MLNKISKLEPSLLLLENYHYYTVEGIKAFDFLQGQFSCDLKSLRPNQVLSGAYLNIKGRVVSSLKIFLDKQNFVVQLPRNMAEQVITKLKMPARLSRVTFTLNHAYSALGLVSPLDDEQVFKHSEIHVENLFIQEKNNAIKVIIGYNNLINSLKNEISYREIDYVIWKQQLIRAKIVEVDKYISEKFTSHDLNLVDRKIASLSKGCYLGQEIVARVEHRGKQKFHLHTLCLQTSSFPQPLEPVYAKNGEKNKSQVGVIISVATTDEGHNMLVLLNNDAAAYELSLFS